MVKIYLKIPHNSNTSNSIISANLGPNVKAVLISLGSF